MASTPRTKFSENQVSAIFAWLLNPTMDHGLGYEFLLKFLERTEIDDDIIKNMKINISGKGDKVKINVSLEYELDEAIIDVVLLINNKHFISIENKIYSSAATNEDQLKIQYECLKRNMDKNQKATIVFLVPSEEGKRVKNEFNNLTVKDQDKKILITWTDIYNDIQDILKKEQNCEISPFNEYVRHTLKAFSVFIKDGFCGYHSREAKVYTMNPAAMEERKNFAAINEDVSITYIGIPSGYTGLLKYSIDELKEKKFQCTIENKPPNHFWVKRDVFLEYIKSIL